MGITFKYGKLKNWGIVVLVAFGIWIATKIKAGMSLSVVPDGVSFDGANLVLFLGVTNASQFPIAFNSFNGQLFVNGQSVGILQDFTPQQIAPLAKTDLNLKFFPNVGLLISDIVAAVQNPSTQTISIQGNLTAENVPILINQTLASLPI